ncbi:MAG TPA: L,D-transpeptidase [Chloroflexota bacterium]|nr:L,D-transpeptidase [Chloroflexota bacterium]
MERRSRWPRVALQVCLLLSLVVAALTGAFIATDLRPANQVVAARQHVAAAQRAASRQQVVARQHGAAPQHSVPSPVPQATDTATSTATDTPTATATTVPTPAAPTRAMLVADNGRAMPYGAWIQAHAVTLHITLSPLQQAGSARAEVEVQPADVPFTGTPTAIGPLVQMQAGVSMRTTIAIAQLADGQRYHWRVRAQAASGSVSDWSGGGIFAVNTVAPPSPQLVMTSVRLHGWSKMTPALFRWTDAGNRAPIGYFELAVVKGAFSGAQTVAWQRAHGATLALPHLAQGYWHVLVRAIDLAGNRSAVADWSFGLANDLPPAPRILKAMPAQGAISNVASPSVLWSGAAGIAPLNGFEYRLSWGAPPQFDAPWTPAAGTRLTLSRLTDGHWYLQIRSTDAAGAHSQATTWSFQLDRTQPILSAMALFSTSFTPPVERAHLGFRLNKQAAIVYQVMAAGSKTPLVVHSLGVQQPGKLVASWNGYLAHGKLAPAGRYTLVIDARDRAGNHNKVASMPVTLLDKRILVSISKEELWAYQGKTLFLKTPVTNGGPDTPTIPGIFHVEVKYLNWVMHSPFPASSPLWYPDSPTNFDLLYQAQGGYFIHDAPWRSNYGPGSNSVAGTPGGNYTGTHGCTNVPLDQMKALYSWADDGTLIQIVK